MRRIKVLIPALAFTSSLVFFINATDSNSTSVILFSQPKISNIDNHLFINPRKATPAGLFNIGQNVNLVSKDEALPWDTGLMTNFYPKNKLASQRGPYASAVNGSAVIAEGDTVGLIINGSQLHHSKLPNETLFTFVPQYNFPNPETPFKDQRKMLQFSMDVQIPTAEAQSGNAYAYIHYLFRDVTSKQFVWVSGGLFDLGRNNPIDFIKADDWDGEGATHHAIVATPLKRPGEMFARYHLPLSSSATFRSEVWKGFKTFKFALSVDVFKKVIGDLRQSCVNCAWSKFSSKPEDYQLFHVSYNPELYYTGAHSLIATSMKNMKITLEPTAASPLYRFFNRDTGAHFYTISPDKANELKDPWVYEGTAGQLYRNANEADNLVPLYIVYNSKTKDYFYTPSQGEKNLALTYGYQELGSSIAGYIPSQKKPCESKQYLYRLWMFGKHFYTHKLNEKDYSVRLGATLEGAYCLGGSK